MSAKLRLLSKYANKIPGLSTVKKYAGKVSRTIWNYTPRDIKGTSAKLRNPIRRGIKKGKRNNESVFKSVIREYKGIRFSKEEYPALAASTVALTPIPSPVPIFPLVYGIGKLIYKAPAFIKGIGKLIQKGVEAIK